MVLHFKCAHTFSGSDIVQYFRGHFYFHANSIGENGHGTNLGDRNTMGIFGVRSSKTFKNTELQHEEKLEWGWFGPRMLRMFSNTNISYARKLFHSPHAGCDLVHHIQPWSWTSRVA